LIVFELFEGSCLNEDVADCGHVYQLVLVRRPDGAVDTHVDRLRLAERLQERQRVAAQQALGGLG
jgi:hypothetical protein